MITLLVKTDLLIQSLEFAPSLNFAGCFNELHVFILIYLHVFTASAYYVKNFMMNTQECANIAWKKKVCF